VQNLFAADRPNFGKSPPRVAVSCGDLGGSQRLGSIKEVKNDMPVVPIRENRIDNKKQEHEPGYRHEQLDIIPHRTGSRLINGTFGSNSRISQLRPSKEYGQFPPLTCSIAR
jgi:hypothetical protein